jgi:hypothetical protein
MHAAANHFVLGYDPGGNNRHGLAVLQVHQRQGLWVASRITALETLSDVKAVMICVENHIGAGALVATGLDTLTAWSLESSGWRQADCWLREQYPDVKNSVASPNSLFGVMSISGSLLLHWLAQRQGGGGMITEAHPKVCYYAMRRAVHPWAKHAKPGQHAEGWQWLEQELGIDVPDSVKTKKPDHEFDALMGCLAALRGLNGQWKLDLHEAGRATEVHPFGQTHYWWPDEAQAKC